MRTVAICGQGVPALLAGNTTLETINICGQPTICGIIPVKDVVFDPSGIHQQHVLVKVEAFSCNYRDLTPILTAIRQGQGHSFFVVGSEFVGQVVAVGAAVTQFSSGARVIGDNHYTHFDGFDGVPTSNASREYQIVHAAKLVQIPERMPNEVAAAFSIGAQTAYSMIRKAQLKDHANVLVTSASSNTSLFIINALRKHNVQVYATTSSDELSGKLRSLGVKEVLPMKHVTGNNPGSAVKACADTIGCFDYVFDPFFDLNLIHVINTIAPGGTYITCGLVEQHKDIDSHNIRHNSLDLQDVLIRAIINNIKIIGNNLGLTSDLYHALEDYDAQRLDIVIDSVFRGRMIGEFFNRLYNAKDRFGKVVYTY